MFKEFFINNQELPNKGAPKTNVSPFNSNCRDRSQSWYTNYSSYNKYDRQIQITGTKVELQLLLQTVTTMKTILRILKTNRNQLFPHRNTSNIRSLSSNQKSQSPAINPIADNLKENFEAANLDKTMTDAQFSENCIYFKVGKIETTNTLDRTIKLSSSCYIPLNVPLKTKLKKQN